MLCIRGVGAVHAREAQECRAAGVPGCGGGADHVASKEGICNKDRTSTSLLAYDIRYLRATLHTYLFHNAGCMYNSRGGFAHYII